MVLNLLESGGLAQVSSLEDIHEGGVREYNMKSLLGGRLKYKLLG